MPTDSCGIERRSDVGLYGLVGSLNVIAAVALGFALLYCILALLWPLLLTRWRTGESALRTSSGASRGIALLFLAGNILIVAAPTLDRPLQLAKVELLNKGVPHAVGIAMAAAAIPLIIESRRTMGSSWRVGVDTTERTALIKTGIFAHVRHPIYSAMVILASGIVLMVPNVLSFACLLSFIVAVELQTRYVEDPYLSRTHQDFNEYASRTGRFLPGVGRVTRF